MCLCVVGLTQVFLYGLFVCFYIQESFVLGPFVEESIFSPFSFVGTDVENINILSYPSPTASDMLLIIFGHRMDCRVLVPQPGIEPRAQH